MNPVLRNLIFNFLLGGAAVATTSYLGTFFDPLVGAIVWAYPITIIPTIFFMHNDKKTNNYISKFLFGTTFALILLLIVTFSLSYIIKHSSEKQSLWIAIGKSTIVFAIGGILYYGIIKLLNLEKYFM